MEYCYCGIKKKIVAVVTFLLFKYPSNNGIQSLSSCQVYRIKLSTNLSLQIDLTLSSIYSFYNIHPRYAFLMLNKVISKACDSKTCDTRALILQRNGSKYVYCEMLTGISEVERS